MARPDIEKMADEIAAKQRPDIIEWLERAEVVFSRNDKVHTTFVSSSGLTKKVNNDDELVTTLEVKNREHMPKPTREIPVHFTGKQLRLAFGSEKGGEEA